MGENWSGIAAEVRAGLGDVGNSLILTRTTPGVVNPAQPWVPVAPVVLSETVYQFGDGSGEFRSGETIIASDFEFMIAVPTTLSPQPGDTITAGGITSTIIKAEPFPAGGVPVYFTIWANR